MIRVVLAVVMATALCAASLPAVETARVERTTAALDRVPERIDRAALSTLAAEPARRSATGSAPTARRVVSFSVPGGSLAAARVRALALCSGDELGTAVFVHAVGDGAPSRTALSAPYDLPAGGIALDGRQRVSLSLVPVGSGTDGRERRIRVRLLPSPTADTGSSTETGPPRLCDPSTASVTASPAGGAPTDANRPAAEPTNEASTRAGRPRAAVAVSSSSTAVRVPPPILGSVPDRGAPAAR
ncbi:DUF7311 family protein [Halobaculum magnesiiphilum]|uniref:DUF7311 domain-containing protein n=1 Tax=Halobaculum magnesiiphilum TaxID=1017351 RepID=A0A8T8WGZ7_9EURY|nr:hypothetical protein [Halobaculum magnesiiphilum]QZP39152.1 hypothetical protein K6T50_00045 [Halobaculum magnesiiphilum]